MVFNQNNLHTSKRASRTPLLRQSFLELTAEKNTIFSRFKGRSKNTLSLSVKLISLIAKQTGAMAKLIDASTNSPNLATFREACTKQYKYNFHRELPGLKVIYMILRTE